MQATFSHSRLESDFSEPTHFCRQDIAFFSFPAFWSIEKYWYDEWFVYGTFILALVDMLDLQ